MKSYLRDDHQSNELFFRINLWMCNEKQINFFLSKLNLQAIALFRLYSACARKIVVRFYYTVFPLTVIYSYSSSPDQLLIFEYS